MVEASHRRARIAAVVALHLIVGLMMASIPALLSPGVRLPIWMQVWFVALIGSELLLLGVWAGLANLRWWTRLTGVLAGLTWLWCICCLADRAGRHPPGSQFHLEIAGMLSACAIVVALGAVACRQFLARMELRSQWEPPPVSQELQFTMRSLIGLTAVIAVLLSVARAVRWWDNVRYSYFVVMLLFSLIAALGAVMVVWSALGAGRVTVRVPVMLSGMAALGLLPYFSSGQARLDWIWVWPLLTVIAALYSVCSLLVARACGYRLVRIEFPGIERKK